MTTRGIQVLGALAILGVGAIHLQQYLGADFSAIPTIGPLFLINAIGSGIVGVALLLPIERFLGSVHTHVYVAVFATVAVVIAAGSLIALFISESGSLFGFSESGYRAAVVIAIVTEGATILLLGPVAAVSFVQALSRERKKERARLSCV